MFVLITVKRIETIKNKSLDIFLGGVYNLK